MVDYELEIKNNNEIYRQFLVDDEQVIGVKKNESFSLAFKNNTSQRVQVRLSIDGTDILTGNPASTKPTGKMWVVEPYSSMSLDAWPEDNEGGAQFVFTNEKDSVAVCTHGNKKGIGLIAAAVYVESESYYISYNYTANNGIWRGNWTIPVCDFNNQVYGSSHNGSWSGTLSKGNVSNTIGTSFSSNTVSAASLNEPTFDLLAVGAGDRVDQAIKTATGLIKPVLDDIVQIRYVPWAKLNKKASSNVFPADQKKKNIDLRNVPKVKTKRLEDMVQRFV